MALTKIQSVSIAANAITAAKIADGTVLASDILDGTITQAKLVDSTLDIGGAKVTGSVANTSISGKLTAGQIVSVANTQITGYITSDQISGLGTMSSQNASAVTITGGAATLTTLKETKVAIAASDIDLSLGNFFTKTITTTTTLTVSNVPSANTAVSFVLELTNGGASTVNWFGNVKWAGGTAPSLTSSGKDCIGFYTFDAGSNWNGFKLGLDVK